MENKSKDGLLFNAVTGFTLEIVRWNFYIGFLRVKKVRERTHRERFMRSSLFYTYAMRIAVACVNSKLSFK